MAKSVLYIVSTALALVLFAGAFLCGVSQPRSIPVRDEFLGVIYDKPLLTHEQRIAASYGETIGFDCAGKHYIVEQMPDEYIYSSYLE